MSINASTGEHVSGATANSRNEGAWPLVLTKGGATVRIFRCALQNGYLFFQVAYYRDGKRVREAIKDEAEARQRARNVLKSLAQGEVEATSMKLQDARAYESALRLLEPTRVTLETACREYADARALLGSTSLLDAVRDYAERRTQVVAEKTVKEVVDEFIAAKEAGLPTKLGGVGGQVGDKYRYQTELRLRKFEAAVPGNISEVDSDAVNEFILSLKNKQGEALSGRTRNNYVGSVQVLLEYARKQRYIARDSTIFDELNEWAEEDFDIEIFSPEELKKILAYAPEALVPVLVIGAFSGLRTAEIARLDWSEVNIEGGHIEVKARKAKTRARRLAPIAPNLASWLSSLRKPGEPVWSLSLPYLHQLQRESAAAAGLKWKHNALRHSFISYRVSATNNVSQVALEAGNSPDIIFQHYRELVAPAATSEWFAITPAVVEELAREQEKANPSLAVAAAQPDDSPAACLTTP